MPVKNSVFALFVMAGALLLGSGAFLLRNQLTRPTAAPLQTVQPADDGASPLEDYQIIEACGACFDSQLNQWSFCESMTLEGPAGSPVYAVLGGAVLAITHNEDQNALIIETDEGISLCYIGLTPSVFPGARCNSGDVIGFLQAETLTLRAQQDGLCRDPAAFFPKS